MPQFPNLIKVKTTLLIMLTLNICMFILQFFWILLSIKSHNDVGNYLLIGCRLINLRSKQSIPKAFSKLKPGSMYKKLCQNNLTGSNFVDLTCSSPYLLTSRPPIRIISTACFEPANGNWYSTTQTYPLALTTVTERRQRAATIRT